LSWFHYGMSGRQESRLAGEILRVPLRCFARARNDLHGIPGRLKTSDYRAGYSLLVRVVASPAAVLTCVRCDGAWRCAYAPYAAA
jgi:hypothetical protein